MENLTTMELNSTKEIIEAGLTKAAESFSFFMTEKITFKELEYSDVFNHSTFGLKSKGGENIHLLITEIIGEIKGVCCLIFSESEADQLRAVALPEEIRNNPELMVEMNDAIMLEVDNIIAASVITQFSNLLKHKIHGGVPMLQKLNIEQLDSFIKNEGNKGLYSINFTTKFVSANNNFSPVFLWLFDTKFIESIKKYSQLKNSLEVANS